jgi:hypothetical protein
MAPSRPRLVPCFSMCRQPLSHIRVAVLLSCRPTSVLPPHTPSRDLLPPAVTTGAADRSGRPQKSCSRHVDSVPDSRRRTRKNLARQRRFRTRIRIGRQAKSILERAHIQCLGSVRSARRAWIARMSLRTSSATKCFSDTSMYLPSPRGFSA